MHFQISTLSIAIFTLLTSTVTAQQPDPEAYNPKAFGRPEGVDIGNKVCTGACVTDPDLLGCAHVEFRPQFGCYICCLSDDDLDGLERTFEPLDVADEDEDEDVDEELSKA
ncbi:uncharacterized protein BDV14DRAFT_200742 [Aspergillus stella-maris]|uniref:uncharacterized protein n=1 Tax=Aspergillus stella-maris TaxID=1810926 RepID=UPI003CCD11E1